MAKDFSKVARTSQAAPTSPGSVTSMRGQDAGKGGWLAPPKLYYVIAAAVVVVIVAVLAFAGGGEEADTAGPKAETVHGPSTFADGLPSGYTRDKGGAATAAVNVIQAISRANRGQADIDQVKARLIAASPSDALTKVIADAKGRPATEDLFNTVPATVTVGTVTDQEAEVAVWTVTAGQSVINAAGQKAVSTVWSTTTVGLVWENGDWKARDWRFQVGPEPSEVSAPSHDTKAIESGYYSFFIN
ncbi:hypothetical protein IU444_28850 [Nocardia farcinica]|uniref:hypothetical protein n=1 Tax=Nocardia farcinica TaxID=37329 RepID=UPI001894B43D|nr:hypothetical protein [Nocardia farcinica]MBF6388140.1 hypothetical protein [Nocardia farcinica]UEX26362.1 hypothetical protein LMJ57_30910 [Nocardia farcinica]